MDLIESLYIHFPFCLKRCNYCDFFSQLKSDQPYHQYELALEAQLSWLKQFHLEHHAHLGKLKSLYIGGGTPGLWGKSGRDWLKRFLEEYPLATETEFTVELNPGAINRAELEAWLKIGVNRFSVGSQSLDPFYLSALDRIHSREQTLNLLTMLKELGVNHSVDLMLGLPFSQQRARELEAEILPLLELGIPHLSAYILTVDPDYCHFAALPDEEWIAREYQKLSQMMQLNGYHHYEVSNFAKPGRESFHNLEYWRNHSVAALGPSAVGTIIRPKETLRYRFAPHSGEAELEIIDEEAQKIEAVFMGLRSSVGQSMELFQSTEGQQIVADWTERKLASCDAGRLILTSRGFLLLDSMIDQLFQYKII